MEYETGECKSCEKLAEKIAAIERERDELKEELRKWRDSRDGMMSIVEKLEADNSLLRKRLEVACHVKADDKVGFDFAVLDKIDSLERERDELIKGLVRRVQKVQGLEKENALLRKRMEPIEQIRGILSDNTYFLHAYAMYIAIVECMELKEGE